MLRVTVELSTIGKPSNNENKGHCYGLGRICNHTAQNYEEAYYAEYDGIDDPCLIRRCFALFPLPEANQKYSHGAK
jgi:hypothetical protein